MNHAHRECSQDDHCKVVKYRLENVFDHSTTISKSNFKLYQRSKVFLFYTWSILGQLSLLHVQHQPEISRIWSCFLNFTGSMYMVHRKQSQEIQSLSTKCLKKHWLTSSFLFEARPARRQNKLNVVNRKNAILWLLYSIGFLTQNITEKLLNSSRKISAQRR